MVNAQILARPKSKRKDCLKFQKVGFVVVESDSFAFNFVLGKNDTFLYLIIIDQLLLGDGCFGP